MGFERQYSQPVTLPEIERLLCLLEPQLQLIDHQALNPVTEAMSLQLRHDLFQPLVLCALLLDYRPKRDRIYDLLVTMTDEGLWPSTGTRTRKKADVGTSGVEDVERQRVAVLPLSEGVPAATVAVLAQRFEVLVPEGPGGLDRLLADYGAFAESPAIRRT